MTGVQTCALPISFPKEDPKDIGSETKIYHPTPSTENVPLEDIRTVVPVENNTTNPNINLDEFEMPIDIMESPAQDRKSVV